MSEQNLVYCLCAVKLDINIPQKLQGHGNRETELSEKHSNKCDMLKNKCVVCSKIQRKMQI